MHIARLEQIIDKASLPDQVKKELKHELCVTERRAYIGLAAARIAHDSNNALTGVLGNSNIAECKLLAGAPAGEILPFLKEITKSVDGLAQMNHSVLSLIKREKCELTRGYLNEIVEESKSQIEQITSVEGNRNYPIVYQLKSKKAVNMYKISLFEALENFVKNAKEAQAQAGLIDIPIAVRTFDAKYSRMHKNQYSIVNPGHYSVLSVEDKGIGMTQEIIDRLKKNPALFTTKGNNGNGLGMVSVLCAVREHHSYLGLETAENKGTTWSIYIPILRKS